MKPCMYCGTPTKNVWYDGIKATCEECDAVLNEIDECECGIDEVNDKMYELQDELNDLDKQKNELTNRVYDLKLELRKQKELSVFVIDI